MLNSWTLLGCVTFSLLALIAIRAGAQSVQPTSETYSWPGELCNLDPQGRTITVKSRVAGAQALAQLPLFNSGDRVVLTWSGFDTYADAISRAVRYDAAKKWSEAFTLPVEFVAYEPARQYVTFKFLAPSGSVEALTSLKPGEWVTVAARHRPSNESDAITAVNPYTVSVSRASTH